MRSSRPAIVLAGSLIFATALVEARKKSPAQTKEEDDSFNGASQLFQDPGTDKLAVVEALESFLAKYPDTQRSADAEFMVGESYMEHALGILKAEAASKKAQPGRVLAPKNPAALAALANARKAYMGVVDDRKSGLAPSTRYRLGEVAYNEKDWNRAIDEFRQVESDHGQSYIAPESLLAIVYSNLALERFSEAEQNLFLLGETYPTFLKEPAVHYAQGIVALHKGDYSGAEKALKRVKAAEAQFYLGKTYLLSKRAFLAAAAFEQLIKDYPESDLKEEAQFFIGDSFFLAEDYTGAISKYQKFISLWPESPLRVSALFRIGSSYFQRRNYVEARAHFQSVLDRYPKDFFAPLAQFFIAESHLVGGQLRDALFAYTTVITQYPETIKVSPLAHFKLAWVQNQVGDYAQSATTCQNFLSLYPTNALAKNVYLVLGNSLIAMKRYPEAVAAFQRIIDLAPSSDIAEQALFSILQTQYNLKSFNSILTSYQSIFRNLPPSKSKWRALSYVYLADAYLASNQVDEAKTIFEMIRKVYPDEPAAFYAQDGVAWCYALRGEDARALEERKRLQEMMAAATSTFTFSGRNELGIADSMFNQKSYDESFQLYEKFANENPDASEAPAALYRAGMSLYHLRYYTQAIETWRKLLARYPESPQTAQAVFQVADTLFRAQKYGEAQAAYRDIVEKLPGNPKLAFALLRISQAAFNAKDDAGTLRAASDLIARFPDSPEAGDGLDLMEGVFDRSKGVDFRAALDGLIKAHPGRKVGGDAQFRLGRRVFEAKDYAGAAVAFQAFSVDYTNHPDLAKAQFFLGESHFNQNNHLEAAPAFERLLNNFDKGQETSLAVFHLASSYYALKKYEEGIRNYTRLIEEYPDSEYVKAAQFNLALAYKAVGKLDMAQHAYQRYVAAAGTSGDGGQSALWEIFQLQRDRRDFDGALGTLEQIRDGSKAGSDAPLEAMYRMGEVYMLMGRPEAARESWERLRAGKPANSPFRLQALLKLAESYEKASDYAAAASSYEELARGASGSVSAQAAQRAQALRKMRPKPARAQPAPTPSQPSQLEIAPSPAPEGRRLTPSPRRTVQSVSPDPEPERGVTLIDEEKRPEPEPPKKEPRPARAGRRSRVLELPGMSSPTGTATEDEIQ